ncbi:MAG: hypothetical protein SF052_18565 [Bacteroidia bacterium]|nr:hypothetical protein [Bacteroidia bacterium]
MITLPPQTVDIFEHLAKGLFISNNSLNPQQKEWYQVLEDHQENFARYFTPLNLQLSRGEGYYFFSRKESRTRTEERIEQAIRYIDWLDFFKSFDPDFGPGYRFETEILLNKVISDRILRKKLTLLPLRSNPSDVREKTLLFLKLVEKAGFIESEQESGDTYRVVAAYAYLESLVEKIKILQP